ncbi:MAG: AraC family transcriptional regulator [Chitinophagaceae bacterium]
MDRKFHFKIIKPGDSLSDFVYCFSSLQNLSSIKDAVIIPNGRIDIHFYKGLNNKLYVALIGLETQPKPMPPNNIEKLFSINLNPLSVEYILHHPIADILNGGKMLPSGFWGFNVNDLKDFDVFCEKASLKMQTLLPKETDERKRRLFELIFTTNGEISVKELSEKVFWSTRQMNQYFNQQFGLSLKTYCNILRFQASLSHIKEGQLFPQLNYYDQSHFIKEIKKLSGASPKELFKNENSRFLQFLHTDTQ